MPYDEDIGVGIGQRIDSKLHSQQHLLVGISRGLDRLSGKRGGNKAEQAPPSSLLLRQITAHVVARCRNSDPETESVRLYGQTSEVATAMRQRAVAPPAMTNAPGNAQELVGVNNVDVLPALAPASGYAQLSARAINVDLGSGPAKLPVRTDTPPLPVKFVAEGMPIPVGRLGLLAVTVTRYKIGAIAFYSEELAQWSVPSIESVIRQGLAEDAGKYLDSVLLGSASGTALQPPGLFYNLTPLAAATGGGQAAVVKDVSALLNAIAPSSDPVLVGNTATVARLGIWAPTLTVPLIVSESMAANALAAIDASALVFGAGQTTILTGVDAVLHGDDAPLPISSVGSPNTVAAPSTSLFQSDLIGLRIISFTGWGWRASNAAAIISGVTW